MSKDKENYIDNVNNKTNNKTNNSILNKDSHNEKTATQQQNNEMTHDINRAVLLITSIIFGVSIIASPVICFASGNSFVGMVLGAFNVLFTYLAIRNQLFKKLASKDINRVVIILAIVFSLPIVCIFMYKFAYFNQKALLICEILFLWISVLPFFILLFLGAQNLFVKIKSESEQLIPNMLVSFTFTFSLLFFIPFQTMLNNSEDYGFVVGDMLVLCLVTSLIFFIIMFSLVSVASSKLFRIIVTSLSFAIFVQYLYLNGNLHSIDGLRFNWKDNVLWSVIDAVIWLGILILPALFYKKLENELIRKLMNFINGCMLAIYIIALIPAWVNVPREAYSYDSHAFSYDEQYVISSQKNVIVFVLDAVDNRYMDELISEGYEGLNDFKDFTLYSNTCSVYEMTHLSIPGMMMGDYFDGYYDYDYFYNKLKDNNFIFNFYNYEGEQLKENESLFSYLNNFIYMPIDYKPEIPYLDILKSSALMTSYQILPDMLKGFVDVKLISFELRDSYTTGINEKNEDFLQNMDMKICNSISNYFVFQHLSGAHLYMSESEDFIDTTKMSLKCVSEYIKFMKECGVYDEAVIIITSDHGAHDHWLKDASLANTPIFLLKKPNEEKDSVNIVNTPEYHADLLATITDCLGFYDDEAASKLGPSLLKFDEGSERERVFYKQEDTTTNIFKAYTFVGDRKDLEYAVDNDIYTECVRER